MQQIEDMEEQVTEFEAVISVLDKYVSQWIHAKDLVLPSGSERKEIPLALGDGQWIYLALRNDFLLLKCTEEKKNHIHTTEKLFLSIWLFKIASSLEMF